MDQLHGNRRKDSRLREAMGRFRRDSQNFDDLSDVYQYTLKEVCALSDSPFAFIIEKCIDDDGLVALRCSHAFLWASAGALEISGVYLETEHYPLIPVEQAIRPLYHAMSFSRATILPPEALLSLHSHYPEFPQLKQVLALPLHDSPSADCVICLANAVAPYQVSFAIRISPLRTESMGLVRLLENKPQDSITQPQSLPAQKDPCASGDLVQAQAQIRAELQRFKAVADLAPMGILQANAEWNIEYVNDRWLEVIGKTREAIMGLSWLNVLHDKEAEPTLLKLQEQLSGGREFRQECKIQRRPDDRVWVAIQAQPLFDLHGAVNGFVATMIDNTYHHDTEQKLRHLAERDMLTGLANRMLFFERLEHALERVERQGALAVLALDLDGFKNVNDTLGHDAGDKMLVEVSQRLLKYVRNEDTVSRVGGDEFFILLEGLADASIAAHVSGKILKALEEPFNIAQQEVFISTSIGICYAVAGQDYSCKTLLKHADMALYRAKDAGRNNYQYYSADLEQASRAKVELGKNLQHALGRAEFEIFYQAQACVKTNQIIGFEALLRWRHPTKGLLEPDTFIDLLEGSGLIVPVSRWLLHVSFNQMRKWIDAGLVSDDAVMSVNISPRQFRDAMLLSGIEGSMNNAGLSGKNIAIELAESALIQDPGYLLAGLKKIRAMGVKVSLDDFGTGFSSLTYLKKYPIDLIKIDGSFINSLLEDKEAEAITRAIITLSETLKLTVVAEGVETEETLAQLKNWQCDAYQGYLLNEPMSALELTSLFRDRLL